MRSAVLTCVLSAACVYALANGSARDDPDDRHHRPVDCSFFAVAITLALEGNSRESASRSEREGGMARRRFQRGSLKQESGMWYVRFREDIVMQSGAVARREVRERVGSVEQYPTKMLARRSADLLVARVNRIDYRPGKLSTVEDFADFYVREGTVDQKRSARKATRHSIENYIAPILGSYRLDEVCGPIPQRLVAQMITQGKSRKTILNVLGALRSMQRRAKQWGYTTAVFSYDEIALPPAGIPAEPRCYSPAEAQSIIEAAPSLKWRCCFALMGYLGIRCGEALGLAWAHIDLPNRVAMIRQAAVEGQLQTVKSRLSRRDLYIPDPLAALLEQYFAVWRENRSGLLFATRNGRPHDGNKVREYVLHPLKARLGLSAGALHAFRHGNATAQLKAGVDLRTVKDNLGHAKIETTLRYTHSVSADQRRAIASVADEMLRSFAEISRPKLRLVKG
jgi:integrase